MNYATYELQNGKWQATAVFVRRAEAEKVMKFHAQGRRYLIADSEAKLEEKKQI